MNRMHRLLLLALIVIPTGFSRADVDPKAIRALYERVTPALVVVQYTFDSELGRRELTTVGVVVGDDGLIAMSISATPTSLPDEQMKEFKVIIPGDEETELDADFLGRDERSSLSFVRATGKHKWTPLKFEDVPVEVGDTVFSVGLLPKDAGYKSYMMTSTVASTLRGPVPQVLVSGDGLGTVGSPVFNAQGQAIGMVHYQTNTSPWFNIGGGGGRGARGGGGGSFPAISNPPKFFVPASDFLSSLSDPPTADSPLKIPHLGVSSMAGLNKAEAEYFDLKGQPAVQVGDVIPGFPADKAGLKPRDIVVKLNGQPLERGDEPDEASQIMSRKIQRMKPGQTVVLSVLREKGQPLKDITVTLEERPPQANRAKRYYAEDLGFTSREMVFSDIYERRLPPDSKGVVVDLVRPNSSAQSGKLQGDDLIVKLNQTPVDSLEQFKTQYTAYRKDHPHDAVVMEVMRGVNTEVVRIEPPQ